MSETIELPFTVVECSSDVPGCEAAALRDFREEGEGWQSKRRHSAEITPETLVVKIQHESDERIVHALEILCHESKIAEKIEISLGIDEGAGPSSWVNLGFITLQSNEESAFQSRELKTVPIEQTADLIQLVLQGCHKNSYNIDNQVGIVGIRLLGMASTKSKEPPVEENITVNTQSRRSLPVSESPMVPVKRVEIPALQPVFSLPLNVKNSLDTKMSQSVGRLETLKRERASMEDFETAGKIKEALGNVYALLVSFKECESQMREAATAEDYALASQLKSERDVKREAATYVLSEVEGKFIGRIDDLVGDLSISTIRDDSFMSPKSKTKLSPHKSLLETSRSTTTSHQDNSEEASEEQSSGSGSTNGQDGDHPLSGVENAEELPAPEDINDNGFASSDLVNKVEELFGSYRTKCFFSKNWALREAALTKMTLLSPAIVSDTNGECAEAMCNIIESAIEDKNVQVYLAALVLLDECITGFEDIDAPASKITSLVSRIVLNLLGKLDDSKQKVVDSAELALLSLASSSCIDKTIIINGASKRVRSKDSKGGRVVKARLHFIENLATEFGDCVAWKRVVEFAKGQKAFEHKDGGVRDAAKSLIVTLVVVSSYHASLFVVLLSALILFLS